MLLLELREAQCKPFIIWPLAHFLIKSRFFLYTLLSEFPHILQDGGNGSYSGKPSLILPPVTTGAHFASLLGPKPRLHWVKATHSRKLPRRTVLPSGSRDQVLFTLRDPPLCQAQGLAPAGVQLGVAERSESLLWPHSVAELSGNPSNTPLGQQSAAASQRPSAVRFLGPEGQAPGTPPPCALGGARVTLRAPRGSAPRPQAPAIPQQGPGPGLRWVTWAVCRASANAVAARPSDRPVPCARREAGAVHAAPPANRLGARGSPGVKPGLCWGSRSAGVVAAEPWWATWARGPLRWGDACELGAVRGGCGPWGRAGGEGGENTGAGVIAGAGEEPPDDSLESSVNVFLSSSF